MASRRRLRSRIPIGNGTVVELVPALQVGCLEALEEDRRSGFMFRAAVGLRWLHPTSSAYLTLEPLSYVLLPPSATGLLRSAVEFGVLKIGVRL